MPRQPRRNAANICSLLQRASCLPACTACRFHRCFFYLYPNVSNHDGFSCSGSLLEQALGSAAFWSSIFSLPEEKVGGCPDLVADDCTLSVARSALMPARERLSHHLNH